MGTWKFDYVLGCLPEIPAAGMKMLINVNSLDTFTLPLMQYDELGTTAMNYDFAVDWGDTNSDTVTAYNDASREHQYAVGGQYTVTIIGICERLAFGYFPSANALLLTEVTQWDGIVFKEMAFAFYDCRNFTITATDIPDVSACIDFTQAFDTCQSLITGFANWNVLSVLSYKWCFYDCNSLDADFSTWDVSGTQNFFSMFENSGFNNASLNNWNVGSATDMNGMFWGCSIDQMDLSAWDVSSVTTFEDMFHLSNGSIDLSGWDVSSGIIFTDMFSNSTFNGSVANWTFGPSSVWFEAMFQSCPFNQSLSTWNPALIASFLDMFRSNAVFNQDISHLNHSAVITFVNMLLGATAFSTANYDLLLNAWANPSAPFSRSFTCSSTYTIATSQVARDYLDFTRAWTITDLGGI